MMNRKARSNDVKGSEIWKRRIQIVHDQLNSRLAGESALRLAQHRWRQIQANAGSFVAMRQQQCEQMTVTATQIEDTLRMLGYFGDKSCFAFLSMRDIFEPPQVVESMFRSGPLVGHVVSQTTWNQIGLPRAGTNCLLCPEDTNEQQHHRDADNSAVVIRRDEAPFLDHRHARDEAEADAIEKAKQSSGPKPSPSLYPNARAARHAEERGLVRDRTCSLLLRFHVHLR
jgi:hypothetical protein